LSDEVAAATIAWMRPKPFLQGPRRTVRIGKQPYKEFRMNRCSFAILLLCAVAASFSVARAAVDPYDRSSVPIEAQPADPSAVKIVLIALDTGPIHPPGEHEHFAGCALLMRMLEQTKGVAPVMGKKRGRESFKMTSVPLHSLLHSLGRCASSPPSEAAPMTRRLLTRATAEADMLSVSFRLPWPRQ
jgi:hypothetical protein